MKKVFGRVGAAREKRRCAYLRKLKSDKGDFVGTVKIRRFGLSLVSGKNYC